MKAGEELFWELAEDLLTRPEITRSTMMGFPCLRSNGAFFASVERGTGQLVVKLPARLPGQRDPVPRRARRRLSPAWIAASRHAAGYSTPPPPSGSAWPRVRSPRCSLMWTVRPSARS